MQACFSIMPNPLMCSRLCTDWWKSDRWLSLLSYSCECSCVFILSHSWKVLTTGSHVVHMKADEDCLAGYGEIKCMGMRTSLMLPLPSLLQHLTSLLMSIVCRQQCTVEALKRHHIPRHARWFGFVPQMCCWLRVHCCTMLAASNVLSWPWNPDTMPLVACFTLE